MRNKDLINLEEAYLSVYEASYIPRTTSVGNINVLSDPSKIEGKTKELENKFEENFRILQTDKDNLDVAVDILNIMDQLRREHYSVDGHVYSEEELYQKLLDDTKTPAHDYELLKSKTILAYKKAGGNEAWYHFYKELFKRLGLVAAPYTRREASEPGGVVNSYVVYYFGVDGEPYRTTIKAGEDGIIHGTGFWRTNRPKGVSDQQWVSGHKAGGQKGWIPKPWAKFQPDIDGVNIEDLKQTVNNDQAAAAFEAKFPPLQYPQYYTKR